MNVSDVVLSCRVRLARNIDEFPFPSKLSKEQTCDLTEKIVGASKSFGEFNHVKISDLNPNERNRFVEKHLVSHELISCENASFLVNEQETLSVMICEEDHMRIQCILPSLDLYSADKLSFSADKAFAEKLSYSQSPRFGYLTACPTNLGTGMRASAMIHLAGLTMAKQTDSLFRQIQKLGVLVRGFYGEGSAALGGIYQLSNQFTLGVSEDDIIETLDRTLNRIAEQEMNIREVLYQKNKTLIEDVVMRSFGICKYAKRLPYDEFMSHISNIKLGISLGILSNIPMQSADELLIKCQSASLALHMAENNIKAPDDVARAEYLRNNFFNMERYI